MEELLGQKSWQSLQIKYFSRKKSFEWISVIFKRFFSTSLILAKKYGQKKK